MTILSRLCACLVAFVLAAAPVAADGPFSFRPAGGGVTVDNALRGSLKLLEGKVDLAAWPGVRCGVLTSQQRIDNGAAMQAALDYANANKLSVYAAPCRYEYTATATQNGRNVGLQIKKDVAGLIGAGSNIENGARFVQFATNHPVLTIGDVGPSTGGYTSNAEFKGFIVGHGVSQTGQTSADGILLGSHFLSTFDDIMVTQYMVGTFPPYVGVQIGLSYDQFFFSNHIGTLTVFAAQLSYIRSAAGGTGNRWDNSYNGSGGPGSRVTLSGTPIDFGPAGVDYGSFGQLNVEWTQFTGFQNAAVLTTGGDGLTIDHLHVEGVKPSGWDPALVHAAVGRVNIKSMKLLDVWMTGAGIGVPSILRTYGDGRITVDHLYARWTGAGTHAELTATIPFRLFADDAAIVGRKPFIQVRNFDISGHTAAFSLDPNTAGAAAGAAGAISSFEEYRFNKSRSSTEGAAITMANANMTVYGQHRRSKVVASVTFTATRTLTLSDRMAASGAGSASVRQPGDIVEVHRTAGGAFDLIVANQSGATLATFTGAGSAGTALSFEWSGTAWSAL